MLPDSGRFLCLQQTETASDQEALGPMSWDCDRGQRLAPGTSKESHTEYSISSVFLSLVFSMVLFPPTPNLGRGEMDTYLVVVSFEF